MANLFDELPPPGGDEAFATLLRRPGISIERIVSHGHTTPEEAPYDQPRDEWILLLAGAARLWREGEGDVALRPGDHLLIPAHQRHRVTWTATAEPTIWLALHFD